MDQIFLPGILLVLEILMNKFVAFLYIWLKEGQHDLNLTFSCNRLPKTFQENGIIR